MTTRILEGDCRSVITSLPTGSVHMVVTSPPYYGLRDYGTAKWEGGDPDCSHVVGEIRTGLGLAKLGERYSGGGHKAKEPKPLYAAHVCPHCGAERIDSQIGFEKTPDAYIAALVDVFREVRRVLRDDGTLWLNIGDSYASGGGSGIQGSHGQRSDRRHTQEALLAKRQWPDAGIKPKDLLGIPWMLAFALRADGWYLRSDVIWAKSNCMPESVTDRPTNTHEHIFLLTKQPRYFYDAEAIREEGVVPAGTLGAKGSKARSSLKGVSGRPPEYWEYTGTRNARNIWQIATKPFADAHFATFPPELPERCIKAGTSEKGCCPACGTGWMRVKKPAVDTDAWEPGCGCYHPPLPPIPCTVLDPFGGAGTTGLVADRLQRDAILVELNPSYAAMARRRIETETGLFGDVS